MPLPSPRDLLASTVAAEAAPTVAQISESAPEATTALVLGDTADPLARALDSIGQSVTRWNRQLTTGQAHTPWPPAGPFHQVWVRLPRSGLEIKMLLAAAGCRVAPEGVVAVYGAKDEGIRSLDKHRPESLRPFETHLIKRRCRLLLSRPTPGAPPEDVADALEAWRTDTTLDWGQGPRSWVYYPGMFAHGRLDPGTGLLIRHLPPLSPGTRVLDFGAGSGVVGAALLELTQDAQVTLLDSDAIALEAARVNVPAATRVAGTDLEDLSSPYDLIVSNPPIHDGKAETLKFVTEMIDGSARVLGPAGRLLIVVQRRLPVEPVLRTSFRESRALADEGPFRVWEAFGPERHRRPPSGPRR